MCCELGTEDVFDQASAMLLSILGQFGFRCCCGPSAFGVLVWSIKFHAPFFGVT
jgi:hypothetical protein